jgi:P-loop ATPase protein family
VGLVIVGGPPDRVETALRVFEAAGFVRTLELSDGASDRVLGAPGGGAETLRAADALGLRYLLVHSGAPDGQPGGTYERAHHRVEAAVPPDLARRARTRDRLLVTCLAFAYRNGIPEGSAWVVDVRFLENPYWVPELKPLHGLDEPVRDFVLRQPAAGRFLDGLQTTLEAVLDDYRQRGRMELTLAFGCTGGRHRSVVMARAMADRLADRQDIEVEFQARELPVSAG